MQPYRTRKVRILNGAHTSIFALSFLYGNETVKQTVDTDFTGNFIREIVFNEIIDTMTMDKDELISFANEVFDRFRNPFIKHLLSSLSLNAISKFKVRVLPSLLEYIIIHNKVPTHLTYAFACLIRFYKGIWKDKNAPLNDSHDILKTFEKIWKSNDFHQIAESTLSNIEFWGQDLTKINSLTSAIAFALEEIENNGIEKGFFNFSKEH